MSRQCNAGLELAMLCRLEGSSVTIYAVHPGVILQTGLTRYIGPMKIPGLGWLISFHPKFKTIPQVGMPAPLDLFGWV